MTKFSRRLDHVVRGAGLLALSLSLMTACATPKAPTLPNWGNGGVGDVVTTTPPNNPIEVSAPPANAEPAPNLNAAPRTFSAGCTGSFSVRDVRTNREISSGRAFNSGNGFIALDGAGRQTRALTNLGTNTTLLFLPDCNCGRTGGTQNSALPPSATMC